MRALAFAVVCLLASVRAQVDEQRPKDPPATPEPGHAADQGQGQDKGQAQEPGRQTPLPSGIEMLIDERAQQLLSRRVSAIRVLQRDKGGLRSMSEAEADPILRSLLTRVGQPLELRKVTTDTGTLWHDQRLAVRVLARPVGDQVEVVLLVEREVQYYERVEFQGLRQLQRSEVDALLGLYPDRQVTSTEALAMRNILVARYHRDGYAFVNIDIDEEAPAAVADNGQPARRIARFRIDEGPKVRVGEVTFRGNASFPALTATFLDAGDYLVRESHVQETPSGIFGGGGAYSREVLEEDVDRLQLFYRSRGFLDAIVTVTDVRLRDGNRTVDLDFLVVEGPRYVIRTVVVEHVDDVGRPVPPGTALYSAAEVQKVLGIAPGQFYDHLRIRRDIAAIETFYGERGHPNASFPGMSRIRGAFRVQWPSERYDDRGGVELTFEVFEGSPKTLRDVIIRGNTATRDRVIRRKVYALPGDRIDMAKIQKSMRYLDATRFFQDPLTLGGPRFEFLPTDRDDMLDLGIDVTEGETGEFRWGVGISSGAGTQGTLQFQKRNFDLWSPPSSWNPITMFGEVLDNRAFHGGGQNLNLLLAPGTQVSQGQIGFTEPDLFGEQFDTTELRVNARRTLRFRDGYQSDTLGADVGFARNFTDEWSTGITFREENVHVGRLSPDATSLAFAAEGDTEVRGARLRTSYRDFDDYRRPTEGVEAFVEYELLGGPFGAEVDLWKARAGFEFYAPIAENVLGHRTVFHTDHQFGLAQGIQGSSDVFLTERFYLGGAGNLRGFDFRGVGPSQFGRPFGGEATLSGTAEIGFPLVPTRLEHELRDRELLRGVAFVDYGLLGLGIGDPTFHELRMSYGVGLRIDVPVLEIPIALDLAWPILYEETDRRRVFLFSISR